MLCPCKWLDQRTGILSLFSLIWKKTVLANRCRAAALIVFALFTQIVTGLVLWTYYSPSAQTAWESVFYMQYVLPYGWLVRGIHHWSAQALVALLAFYLFMQVMTGRYRAPREFVFWSSVALFGLALGCCLTGDLLTWTISGFSATKVRVSFLNLIPEVGPQLYQFVIGGPEFGTFTLTRFLVLHIVACAGPLTAVVGIWLWFYARSQKMILAQAEFAQAELKFKGKTSCNCKGAKEVPYWSCQAVQDGLACVILMVIVLALVLQQPLLGKIDPKWGPNPELPFQATVGAELMSPADSGDFYGGARPEWSFRALYYLSNMECFPGDKKYIPIFIIPACLGLYALLIPFIGYIRPGHYLNVLIVLGLTSSVGYMTYMSYAHDADLPDYQREIKLAESRAERAIELALAPSGIPAEGALSLLRNDPKTQGPVLFEQHCASCHAFTPREGEPVHPDFPPIVCEKPTAPNLYQPLRRDWIAGFFDFKKLTSVDYYGNTAFNLKPEMNKKDFHGKMYDYVRSLPARMEDEDYSEENNPQTLAKLIDILADEMLLERPRSVELGPKKAQKIDGLDLNDAYILDSFGCLATCHRFYDYDSVDKKTDGPDLSGYMSREWMIEMIADPTTNRFFKDRNDRMPAYHKSAEDSTMTRAEIEHLVDWLRGKWYRAEKPVPTREDWFSKVLGASHSAESSHSESEQSGDVEKDTDKSAVRSVDESVHAGTPSEKETVGNAENKEDMRQPEPVKEQESVEDKREEQQSEEPMIGAKPVAPMLTEPTTDKTAEPTTDKMAEPKDGSTLEDDLADLLQTESATVISDPTDYEEPIPSDSPASGDVPE